MTSTRESVFKAQEDASFIKSYHTKEFDLRASTAPVKRRSTPLVNQTLC